MREPLEAMRLVLDMGLHPNEKLRRIRNLVHEALGGSISDTTTEETP